MGTVNVLDASNQWHPVSFLIDTGNDSTLITKQTAVELGWNPDEGQPIRVQGVTVGATTPCTERKAWIQIGDLEPTEITMMICDTATNLLGRRDILGKFSVTVSDRQAIYEQNFCQYC